jgi:hypothetical protein
MIVQSALQDDRVDRQQDEDWALLQICMHNRHR